VILSLPTGTGGPILAAAARLTEEGLAAERLTADRPAAWTGVIPMASANPVVSASPVVSAIAGAACVIGMAVLLATLPE